MAATPPALLSVIAPDWTTSVGVPSGYQLRGWRLHRLRSTHSSNFYANTSALSFSTASDGHPQDDRHWLFAHRPLNSPELCSVLCHPVQDSRECDGRAIHTNDILAT